MNNVILVGRLVRDPEIKYVGEKNTALSTFTLAVPREYKSQNGDKKVDFIDVELWGRKAEVCHTYLVKGRQIALEGRIEVDSYIKSNGDKRYVTKVRGNKFSFADSKGSKSLAESGSYYNADFIFVEDKQSSENVDLNELPF